MKALDAILIVLMGIAVGYWSRGFHQSDKGIVTHDTVTNVAVRTEVKVDTLYILRPIPYARYMETTDTIRFDSCSHVREVAEYGDSSFHAKVSGISPRLDEIRVYPRTEYRTEYVTRTIAEKRKRFGIGLQTGYGYPHGWYVGIGASYNLFSW